MTTEKRIELHDELPDNLKKLADPTPQIVKAELSGEKGWGYSITISWVANFMKQP